MPVTNSASAYGTVAKTFHWAIALLILTLIPLGLVANAVPFDSPEELTRKATLFSIHKTLGITVFFTALARIIWAISQPKPASLNPDRKVEHWVAETVHWLLYGSLVLVPLSGWIHHAATTGFAPIWWPFGQNLPFVPKNETVAASAAGLHFVFARVLAVSILLHVAGALKHHFVDRDATLRRMWFGTTALPEILPQHHSRAPIVSALSIWAIAITLGGTLGLYEAHNSAPPSASLDAVDSEWEVQSGKVAIEVLQLGSKISGEFADWTAAITFDPEAPTGKAGEVEATISIGSLTLGSVTGQALGAEYLAAEEFPTAVFKADIVVIPDGHAAEGTLTIRDVSMPVRLPFYMQFKDGIVTMDTSVTLNRLDFGVGANQTSESSVGFAVDVLIEVTAKQPE